MDHKTELLARLNANNKSVIESMKERVLNSPNMDPKLKEAILKLGTKPQPEPFDLLKDIK